VEKARNSTNLRAKYHVMDKAPSAYPVVSANRNSSFGSALSGGL
jgi:hypothetical protein